MPAPAVIILIQLLPILIQYLPEIIEALAKLWDAMTEDQREVIAALQAMPEEERQEMLQQVALVVADKTSDYA